MSRSLTSRLGAPLALLAACAALGALPCFAPEAQAQTLRERLKERLQERRDARASEPTGDGSETADETMADLGGGRGSDAMSCADWSRRVNRLQERAAGRHTGPAPDLKNLAYGEQPLQTLDVYQSKATAAGAAPVIVMVHGGGWCVGDKASPGVTENKVSHWTPRGFIVVSVNYPMVAEGSDALAQAGHIARALAHVQVHAAEWGGDPARVILMGHSAGAHLVSLVNANPALRAAHGAKPVLGAVSLDAGAINVVTQMPLVYPFLKTRYLEAFGSTEAEWIPASPFHQLAAGAAPWLGVCSTQRKDDPCAQARAYVDKSQGAGIAAEVLPQAKNHGAINKELGQPGAYTERVERFMASLDARVAALLGSGRR